MWIIDVGLFDIDEVVDIVLMAICLLLLLLTSMLSEILTQLTKLKLKVKLVITTLKGIKTLSKLLFVVTTLPGSGAIFICSSVIMINDTSLQSKCQ